MMWFFTFLKLLSLIPGSTILLYGFHHSREMCKMHTEKDSDKNNIYALKSYPARARAKEPCFKQVCRWTDKRVNILKYLVAAVFLPLWAVWQCMKGQLAECGGERLFQLDLGLIQILWMAPWAESSDLEVNKSQLEKNPEVKTSIFFRVQYYLLQSSMPRPAH